MSKQAVRYFKLPKLISMAVNAALGYIHSQWYDMVRKRDDEIFDLKGKVEKTIEKENESLKDDLQEKEVRFCRTQERLRKYKYEERLRISRKRRAIRIKEGIKRKVRIEEEERERVREELHAKKKKPW